MTNNKPPKKPPQKPSLDQEEKSTKSDLTPIYELAKKGLDVSLRDETPELEEPPEFSMLIEPSQQNFIEKDNVSFEAYNESSSDRTPSEGSLSEFEIKSDDSIENNTFDKSDSVEIESFQNPDLEESVEKTAILDEEFEFEPSYATKTSEKTNSAAFEAFDTEYSKDSPIEEYEAPIKNEFELGTQNNLKQIDSDLNLEIDTESQPPANEELTQTYTKIQKIKDEIKQEKHIIKNLENEFGDSHDLKIPTQIVPIEEQERLSPNETPSSVQPSAPFHLFMTGFLDKLDREKFCDLVTQNNMGPTRVELESQLDAGKVILPQMSEFAAIFLIQALRDAPVQFRLVPTEVFESKPQDFEMKTSFDPIDLEVHPADSIQILKGTPPHPEKWDFKETLIAQVTLETTALTPEKTEEYDQLLHRLQRKLRFLAYRKKATHIWDFQIEILQLHNPTQYKVTLSGTAATEKIERETTPFDDLDSIDEFSP